MRKSLYINVLQMLHFIHVLYKMAVVTYVPFLSYILQAFLKGGVLYMKTNVAVFFGGKSVEHEISVITAYQAFLQLDKEKYHAVPVYISGGGEWYGGENILSLKEFEKGGIERRFKRVFMAAGSSVLYAVKKADKKITPLVKIDAALLCMHGVNGEDGSLAGFLQLCGVPCTACGMFAAGAAMDKAASKLVFKAAGLKTLKYNWFYGAAYKESPLEIIEKAEKEIGYPAIVKPSNLGSSIGVSVCNDREELQRAVETAAAFDIKIIIERALTDFYEINCSALGFQDDVRVSECEMPIPWKQFLSFDDKYTGQGNKAGMENCRRQFPADIPKKLSDKIKGMTRKAFEALGCKGVVRTDYLVDKKTDNVYINEVNTIPGSLSFYLWEPEGLSFTALLDRLLNIAVDEHKLKNELVYAYKSDVIKAAAKNLSGAKTIKL